MNALITIFGSLVVVIVTSYFIEKELKKEKIDDFDPANISVFSVFIYLKYKLRTKGKLSLTFWVNIISLIVLIGAIIGKFMGLI